MVVWTLEIHEIGKFYLFVCLPIKIVLIVSGIVQIKEIFYNNLKKLSFFSICF